MHDATVQVGRVSPYKFLEQMQHLEKRCPLNSTEHPYKHAGPLLCQSPSVPQLPSVTVTPTTVSEPPKESSWGCPGPSKTQTFISGARAPPPHPSFDGTDGAGGPLCRCDQQEQQQFPLQPRGTATAVFYHICPTHRGPQDLRPHKLTTAPILQALSVVSGCPGNPHDTTARPHPGLPAPPPLPLCRGDGTRVFAVIGLISGGYG